MWEGDTALFFSAESNIELVEYHIMTKLADGILFFWKTNVFGI